MFSSGSDLLAEANGMGTDMINKILAEQAWPMGKSVMVATDKSGDRLCELMKTHADGAQPMIRIYEGTNSRRTGQWDIRFDKGRWDIFGVTDSGQFRCARVESLAKKLSESCSEYFVDQVLGTMQEMERHITEAEPKVKQGKEGVKDLRRIDLGAGHLLYGVAPQKDGKWVGITPKGSKRFGKKEQAVRWFMMQAPQIGAKMGFRDELKKKDDVDESFSFLAEAGISKSDQAKIDKIAKIMGDDVSIMSLSKAYDVSKSLSKMGGDLGAVGKRSFKDIEAGVLELENAQGLITGEHDFPKGKLSKASKSDQAKIDKIAKIMGDDVSRMSLSKAYDVAKSLSKMGGDLGAVGKRAFKGINGGVLELENAQAILDNDPGGV